MPYCHRKKWTGQCCVLMHLNIEMHLQLCLRDAPGNHHCNMKERVDGYKLVNPKIKLMM